MIVSLTACKTILKNSRLFTNTKILEKSQEKTERKDYQLQRFGKVVSKSSESQRKLYTIINEDLYMLLKWKLIL